MGGVQLTDHLPAIAAGMEPKARVAVIKAIADVKAYARMMAPVDTGALRNSIYGQTMRALEGEVFTGMEYAPYVEYGTTRMAAQPYMTPAAEAVRPAFTEAMRSLT